MSDRTGDASSVARSRVFWGEVETAEYHWPGEASQNLFHVDSAIELSKHVDRPTEAKEGPQFEELA